MKMRIMESVIEIAGGYGLENVTTKKIATQINISEGTIYRYYENKVDLYNATFSYINKDVDRKLQICYEDISRVKDRRFVMRALWDTFLKYWLNSPDKAVFYDQFRHSFYFTKEVEIKSIKDYDFFKAFVKSFLIGKTKTEFTVQEYELLWNIVIETTLQLVLKVKKENCELSSNMIEGVFDIIKFLIE